MKRRAHRVNAYILGAVAIALSLGAHSTEADLFPVGGEFQVNTNTTDSQLYPSVAADGAGRFVVVWKSYFADHNGTSGQRFNGAHQPIGTEFATSAFTLPNQYSYEARSVGADEHGNYVVTWASYKDSAETY